MQNKNPQPAAERAAGAGGNPARQQNRVPAFEIATVRSYMFEQIETKETLHIDRLGAEDVVMTLEKLAMPSRVWVCTDGDVSIIKLNERWRVKIMRDAVIVKAGDYVLVADDRFLLLRADEDGGYVPIVKGSEITWAGTEEYFTPFDVRRFVKDTARRILEQARWLATIP